MARGRGSSKTHNKAKRAPGGLGGPTGRGIRSKAQRRTLEEAPLEVPKGAMKKGPDVLARATKDAAERATAGPRKPSAYRAAMTWLTEQAERESKIAKPERRKLFERAKDIVRSLFGMPGNTKGAGGAKGGKKSTRTPRRRRGGRIPAKR